MLIAIIDDGIDTAVCDSVLPGHDLYVTENGTIRPRKPSERGLAGHGTTCAMIIKKYAPTAQFCSLMVFTGGDLSTSVEQLACALNWCLKKKIPIIHLSLGSRNLNDYTKLRHLVAQLRTQGQIIVAAHCPGYQYTIPACLTEVLGVSVDPELHGNQFIIKNMAGIKQVQIYASSSHSLYYPDHSCYNTGLANSYAAPTITAAVHEALKNETNTGFSIPDIYTKLAGAAINVVRLKPDYLYEAVLCNPLHMTLWQKYLAFQIAEEFDDDYSLNEYLQHHPNATVVLFPPADISWIHNIESLHGLLYAGIPGDTSRISSILYWDEQKYKIMLEGIPRMSTHEEVPMVFVEASEKLEEVLFMLNEAMENDGYISRVISTQRFAYLYGFDFLPEGIALEDMIEQIILLYNPDIVFVFHHSLAMKSREVLYLCSGDHLALCDNMLLVPDDINLDIIKALQREIESFFNA